MYRTAASDSAPEAAGALELPDYGKGHESHSLGGITLPASVTMGAPIRPSTGASASPRQNQKTSTVRHPTAPGAGMSRYAG